MRKIALGLIVFFALGAVLPAADDPAGAAEETQRPPPDDVWLKEYLMGQFTAIDGYDRENTRRLKEEAGVSDSQLRRILLDIYSEAETAFEQAEDQFGRMVSALRRENAVRELGVCADDTTKTFLLDLAADASKEGFLRTIAGAAYLNIGDTKEVKMALRQFLIGEERMDDQMRIVIYQNTQMAWHEANSIEKKAAILAALYAALSEESPPWVFRVGDQIVQEMSPRYANSKQRLALLERALAYPFPERRQRTKRELESRLEAMRKLKGFSTVNTNLAVLQERDFNQPLPEDDWMALAITPPEAPAVGVPPENEPPQGRRSALYAIGGTALLALGGAGVLVFRKRHGASRP